MLVTGILIGLLAACNPQSESTTTTSVVAPPVVTTTSTVPAVRTGPGVEDGLIRVGVLVPRSGPLAAFGESVVRGQSAYWRYVNDVLGGVGGEYEVEVTFVDHAYDTDLAADALDALAGDVLGLAGGLGSAVDEALAPLLEDRNMMMVAGSLSSEWVGHVAVVPNLMLPTYRDQVAAGLAWAAGRSMGTRTAILYQEGAYGDDCARGYDGGLVEAGLTDVARVAHAPGATDFADAAGRLGEAAPDLVVVCTTPDALVRIIATAGSLGVQPVWLLPAQSFDAGVPISLGGDAGAEAGLALLADARVVGAGPGPGSPAFELMADVLGAGVETDWYTQLGYAQAATFHLILEEALQAGDLSRDGLLAAVAGLDGIDMGLDGPLSSLTGPAPVDAAAVGVIDAGALEAPFGIPASEPYVATPFASIP